MKASTGSIVHGLILAACVSFNCAAQSPPENNQSGAAADSSNGPLSSGANPALTPPNLGAGNPDLGFPPAAGQAIQPALRRPSTQMGVPQQSIPRFQPPSFRGSVFAPPPFKPTQPLNLRPVLPPSSPVTTPRAIQPAVTPQGIAPALTPQGISPAVTPPLQGGALSQGMGSNPAFLPKTAPVRR